MFVLASIPLSLILRKANAACKFSRNKEKINHLLFMDDLKLHSCDEKGLGLLVQTIRVFSEDRETRKMFTIYGGLYPESC